ncbi:unnamed protein product, partial [Brenthis ino]
MNNYCNTCNKHIKSAEKIKCAYSNCSKQYHYICAGVTADLKKHNTWKCSSCKEKLIKLKDTTEASMSGSIGNDISNSITLRRHQTSGMSQRSREPGESFDLQTEILEAIRNDLPGIIKGFISCEFTNLKESLNEIEKSIKFISAQYDDALKTISSIKEEVSGLKKENASLRNNLKELQGTVNSLEHDLNKHEQWARLQNLEILGIPESKNECLPELVQEIALKSGVNISDGEFEFVHRVQPRKSSSGKPRPIVVRFKSRQKKDSFLSSVRKCKNSTSDLGIPESWLCDGILDSELCHSRYDVFRHDRGDDRRGGGILILCSNVLNARHRPEWTQDDLECLWLTIDRKTLKCMYNIHLATIYIPPDGMLPSRINIFTDMLKNVVFSNPGDVFIILGDFNLPCIRWTSEGPVILKKGTIEVQDCAVNLLNIANFLGLKQYNSELNSSGNTLDLIFCNFEVEVTRSLNIMVAEDEYHPTLSIDITDVIVPLLNPKVKYKYLYNMADYEIIRENLRSFDWSFILSIASLDEALAKFYEILYDLIDKYVPKVVIHDKNIYPIWYNRSLIHIINDKRKAHADWKKYGNIIDYEIFSLLRRRFKILENELFQKYIQNTENLIKINPKHLNNYIKDKRKIKCNYPSALVYQNNIHCSEDDICRAFASYFECMFQLPLSQYPLWSLDSSESSEITSSLSVDTEMVRTLPA